MWGFLVASRCIFILITTLLDHRNTATTIKLDFKKSHLTSVGAALSSRLQIILINDAIKVVLDVVFVPLVKYPLHVAKIFHRVFKILSMLSFWHANSPHRTTSWLAADMVNVARRPEMYACESGSRKNKNNPRASNVQRAHGMAFIQGGF